MTEFSGIVTLDRDGAGRPTCLRAFTTGDTLASSVLTQNVTDAVDLVNLSSDNWDSTYFTVNNYSATWGGGGVLYLTSVGDVTGPAVADQTIVYDGTEWQPTDYTLTALKDVNVTVGAGINGYVLAWNNAGGYWEAVAQTGGGGATDLDDLTDVVVTTPSINQVLYYTGSNWANATASHSWLTATGTNTHNNIDTHITNHSTSASTYWNPTYTTVNNNSANWTTAYTHSQVTNANPHSTTLAQLGTVIITAAANKDVLFFNGTNWVDKKLDHNTDFDNAGTKPHTTIEAELGYLATFSATTNSHINDTSIHFTKNSINLNDLGDVNDSSRTNGDVLFFNGTNWVDKKLDHNTDFDNAGTKPHTTIEAELGYLATFSATTNSHINNTANPHNTTAQQVGNTTEQWNASAIASRKVIIGAGPAVSGLLKFTGGTGGQIEVEEGDPINDGIISFLGSNTTNASALQGSPVSALLSPVGGDILVFDPELDIWTASSVSSITTSVSSTNAFSSTYALSATSALNAQQAPNGFNVTGTVLATTVSATNYLNIRPNVSSVNSASVTSFTAGGDYDTYLINTTTTSVTAYLPEASSYTNKMITFSKVDDGGSYRSVTISGTQLVTATNTVILYDPTESVTVISNGTNWYSLDYDRAYGVVVVCKNSTGATLTKGTPVKISGATGANVLITAASAANNHVPQAPNGSLSRCIGVVEHDIPTGEFGHVLTKGVLYKYNTGGYTEGDQLYLSPSGGFTNVKPTPPYDEVFIGVVTRQQAINGSILIDIANPIHINDIVGFNLASGISNRDLIAYDLTTSTFKNYAPSSFDVSSATSATLAYSSTYALSSTSALNAQQAPNGFTVTGTLAATTVSATTYENLGNTVAKWNASAIRGITVTNALPDEGNVLTYNAPNWVPAALPTSALTAVSATSAFSSTNAFSATNALSATSALNAQQAPNGFNVTGTLRSPVVSATNVSATGTLISYTISAYDYLNIDHTTIGSIGSNSHDDIDNHINSTSNPHSVTAEQVGNTTAQWNASALVGYPISSTLTPAAGQALMYNGSQWTASAALFAYTYGSGAPTGGSDGDIYLQTDVNSLQIPTVSATTYLNLPSGTLTWTYATSATSALNAQQAPNGFSVTGNLTTTSGDVSAIRLTDYSESKSSPSISSSSLTLDLNAAQVFTVTLNSNISTLTISNTDSRANTAQGFTLILTADGTARTITWPGSVKWPSGTGPTLTSTNNKVDILSFVSPDNGTTWYGFIGGQNY